MITNMYLVGILFGILRILQVISFPMVSEVDIEKCYTYHIPEDDDAHMVFVLLPDELEDEVKDAEIESYWINTLYDMSKDGGEEYPDEMEDIPSDIKTKIGEFLGKSTRLQVKIQKKNHKPLRTIYMKYHTPILINDVEELAEDEGHEFTLDGWNVCFINQSDDMMRVVFDVVLYSEETEEEKKKNHQTRKAIKKAHLTPLEHNFNEALVGAERILSEMKYMEKREQRMRHTADSTNKRVRYFSYLSVFVLLGTAWIQIAYLKNYFKKKKLM